MKKVLRNPDNLVQNSEQSHNITRNRIMLCARILYCYEHKTYL